MHTNQQPLITASTNALAVRASGTAKPRILIFIGSLRHGGKERRLLELLTYLKAKDAFEFLVVVTRPEIHYQNFYKLDIPLHIIKKKWKQNDPTVVYRFYKICRQFQPHLIHTWGRMQSLYTLPAVIAQGIPLVNSQITGAPVILPKWSVSKLIDTLNFRFSTVVLANSKAGLEAYKPPTRKRKVIYNGINMNRFRNLPGVEAVKAKYGIATPHVVLMTASFTYTKNYSLFFRIAEKITACRDDITFVGAGGWDEDDTEYKRMLAQRAHNSKILFPGPVNDVEALVNACTIGVLFSANGEGISNAILEYMALGKPVIANKAGGTKELVRHNESGYLIENETDEEIVALLLGLIDDPERCRAFGNAGRQIIETSFTLEKMGQAFEQVYRNVLA